MDAQLSVPLSALQHYLYCQRQCALIHVERLWSDNYSTAEGNVLHEKAHAGLGETRPGVRITRGLEVRSETYGLHGQCDIVEIHQDGRATPVEYKRGRPKAHRADEIQLCGQAICLEETLGLAPGQINEGFLFYGQTKRRTPVSMDEALRTLTLAIAAHTRAMLQSGQTPPASYSSKTCDRCSLIRLCQPRSMRLKQGVGHWFDRALNDALSE